MNLRDFLKNGTPQGFQGKALTCVPSDHDRNDFKYAKLLANVGLIPDSGGPIDYRPNMPPVFNQEKRGSCVSASSAWGPKAFAEINEGDFPSSGLSAAFLHAMCKSVDGNPNEEGTQPRIALKVLQKYGICPEEWMPYWMLTNLPSPQVPPIPTIAMEKAAKFKIDSYAQLAGTMDVSRDNLIPTIRQALLREGPIVVAGLVCSNFVPDENGVIPLPQGQIQGSHQYVFAGHLPEQRHFIMRNTWGRKWGIDGYSYMHEDWLTAHTHIADVGVMYYIFEMWTQTDIVTPKTTSCIEITPDSPCVIVDGAEVMLDQPAFTTAKGRVVLPIRAIAGNMGYLVSWRDGKAILTKPN